MGLLYRSFKLDRAAVNEDKRSADVSFSSETPVRRWGEDEILLHGDRNVNLARLKSMGAALLGHNSQIIVGSLKNVRLEDRRGTATIRFDEDEDGDKAFSKVKSGSLKGVSVGFIIEKAAAVNEDEEWQDPETKKNYKGPAFIATRWTPYEISLTPIPADATVGVARSMDGVELERSQKHILEERIMTEEQIRKLVEDMLKGFRSEIIPEIVKGVRDSLSDDQKPKMNVTVEQSRDLIARATAVSPECRSEVTDMVFDGKTEPEILRSITDAATKDPDADDKGDLGTGLNTKKSGQMGEIRSFDQIDDDAFFRGLANPSTMPMN